MEINKIIKQRRLELGLTLKDVSNALNIAESTVSRYESSDIQNMGIDKIEALSKVLKCSPAYLMGWEDNLTETNADLVVDLLSDNQLIEHVDKLKNLTKEHQQTIFDNIDYWYEKEGH